MRTLLAASLLQSRFWVKSLTVLHKTSASPAWAISSSSSTARWRASASTRRRGATRSTALPGAPCREACAAIAARAEALTVVVEGAGGHFSAGADIAEFETVYRDAAATRDYVDAMQAALGALAALDRPTIAAIEGSAIGGGLAVALCCDLRFAADDAHLAAPPAKLGLLYGPVETSRLVALIGPARAKDLLFSGRRVAPAEALAIGLVDRVVPAAALKASVEDYAAALAAAQPALDPRRQARSSTRSPPAWRSTARRSAKRSRTRRSARISAKAAPPSSPSARRASPSAARPSRSPEAQSSFDSGIAEVGAPSMSSGGSTGGGAGLTSKATGGGIAAEGPCRSSGPASGRMRRGRRPSARRDRAPAAGRRAGRAAVAGRAAGSAGNSGAGRSRSSRASPGRDGNGCSGRRRRRARARW